MNVGLNAAVQGLLVAQRAMDVAGHNVANADTPGFSRQRANISATLPQDIFKAGQLGTGVQITDIKRVRDQFIDRQVRLESAPLGEAKVAAETLTHIEDIFGEPSERSLATLMSRFWDGWHELTAHPENVAVRINLREVGANLAGVFREIHDKLNGLRQDVNDRLATEVENVTSLTDRIARLNFNISAAVIAGQDPNDLQDQQDLLIEQLSEVVKVQVSEAPRNGTKNVYVDGQVLVIGASSSSFHLVATPILAKGFIQINYGPTGIEASVPGGSLKGVLDARNITLSDTDPRGFLTKLNDLASGMMSQVNTLHRAGFGLDGTTGLDFFTGTDASDIMVNPNITDLATGTDLIAAAGTDPGSLLGGPGDNGNAVAIAQLRNTQTMVGNTATFDDFYKAVLTTLGTQGQETARRLETQEMLITSVRERRDAVSGVSTDEEMANVIRFQKAYAASARILTTIDEMLERLMTMGVVGR